MTPAELASERALLLVHKELTTLNSRLDTKLDGIRRAVDDIAYDQQKVKRRQYRAERRLDALEKSVERLTTMLPPAPDGKNAS